MDFGKVTAISARNITKRFGSLVALEDITFEVQYGRFVSVVGPSGCGKSTLLHIIAGLTSPSAGQIDVFGKRLDGINRRTSYMFQRDALLPWKTVLANIQLGLLLRGHSRQQAVEQAKTWLQRIGLDAFGDHYPHELSGGMKKRVAIAQCWIVEPDIVLMDEPFSALDVHTRSRMEEEILKLWSSGNTTVILVTHDLDEAIALSDEVFVLSASPRSRLVGRYPINLTRPRNIIDITSDPHFQEIYQTIWRELRKEVLKVDDRICS